MKYVWLLLLTISISSTMAQNPGTYPLATGEYLKSYFTNGIQLAVSPLHWQQKDWLIAGGTLATSAGLYLADGRINKTMIRWQASSNGSFGNVGDALGPKAFIGTTLVALGTGIIAGQPGLTSFAQDNLQAQLYTGGICYFAKVIFGRQVPGNHKQYWKGPFQIRGVEYGSFFSAHTSIAFATATSIYLHSNKKWWVGAIGYGIASGIGLSRMQLQAHWASDVFFSAVVGTAVSAFVFRQNQKKREDRIYF